MQIPKFTTDAGIELNVNPINVGVWSPIPQAVGLEPGTKIEVNGIVYIVRDSFKKVDKLLREALQPE